MSDGEEKKRPFTWERPPFETCPKCRSPESFGVLSAGGNALRKRCTECRYSHGEMLPKLEKKVIYLDQFAFSDCTRSEAVRGARINTRLFGQTFRD